MQDSVLFNSAIKLNELPAVFVLKHVSLFEFQYKISFGYDYIGYHGVHMDLMNSPLIEYAFINVQYVHYFEYSPEIAGLAASYLCRKVRQMKCKKNFTKELNSTLSTSIFVTHSVRCKIEFRTPTYNRYNFSSSSSVMKGVRL